MTDTITSLVHAIQARAIVQLAYRRQRDEVTTLHRVAPVDIRPGGTDATAERLYLWAYCYAENKLEKHLIDRVVLVEATDQFYSPRDILTQWPKGWLLPDEWIVPRGDGSEWTTEPN